MTIATGATIDADAIAAVVREVAQEPENRPGPRENLVDSLLAKVGAVINPAILTEWEQTCSGGSWYREWYLMNLTRKKIVEVEVKGVPGLRKKLRVEFGLPFDSRDYKYIICAKQYKPHYLLSQDIDVYDPRARAGSSADRHRAREMRNGALCRYLKAEYGVVVGTLDHCASDQGL